MTHIDTLNTYNATFKITYLLNIANNCVSQTNEEESKMKLFGKGGKNVIGHSHKNTTHYSPVHTSNPNRSRPDSKPHVTKSSFDSSGNATRTHHYEGSSEYRTGKGMHGTKE